MRNKKIWGILVLLLILTANFVQAEEMEKEVVFPMPPPQVAAKEDFVITGDQTIPYVLGRDDVVRIIVLRHPELSGDFVVGPDGKIQYTFVGDVQAEGLTKEELKGKLKESLAQYVKIPEISVAIIGYNSKKIYVLGEVVRPGMYSIKGNFVSLREAIVQAGLHTRRASLRRTVVIKPDFEKPKKRFVNLGKILYEGKLEENLTLYPNDVVYIPSTVLTKVNDALGPIVDPLYKATVLRTLTK